MIAYLKIAKFVVTALSGIALFVIARRAFGRLPMPVCNTSIEAVHHGGIRPLSQIRLIVLHDTEGPTAINAAHYFANEASSGSAHYVVDDLECYQTLPDDIVPWGATGDRVNEDGIHIEQACGGEASCYKWTRAQWLEHEATILKAAAIAQNKGRDYNIPMRFLTAADMKRLGNDARGITTHWEVTKAFDVDGGHVDPGTQYPIDVFMKMVGG